MRLSIIAAILLTSACAGAPPRVLHYKQFEIVIASQYQVDSLCRTRYSDSGSYIGINQHIEGCYDGFSNPPRIIVDHEHPEVLTHELAHWDGHADPGKDGYNWNK